jgi:VWFA-related protein
MVPRLHSVVLTAVLAAGSVAPARSVQPQPSPVFRGGIDLLTIDVMALDGEGRPVTDLTPAEFTAEVDGRPRPVIAADYVRLVDPGRPVGVSRPVDSAAEESFFSANTRPQARGRQILFLIDQGNIRSGAGRPVMASASAFVDRLTPDDRVAVVSVPGAGELVDFTADHDRVREALLRIVGRASRIPIRHNISLTEAKAIYEKSDPRLADVAIRRECEQSGPDFRQCVLEVEIDAAMTMMEMRSRSQLSLQALREVLRSIGRVPGPKSVILVSEGFVFDELSGDADSLATAAADSRATLDILLLDVPMFDAAVATVPTTPREDRDLLINGLEVLAARSRGSLFRVNTTAGFAFDRIERSLSGYYLLGLESRVEDRQGRRVGIAVKSTRSGVTVRSRRSVLAPISAKGTSAVDAVARALQSPLPIGDLPLRVAASTAKEPGSNRVRLLVAVEVERGAGTSLDYTTGLLLVSQTGLGLAPAVERKTLTPKRGDPATAVWSSMVTVEPGTYTMGLAMADAEGRLGSVSRRIVAPFMGGPAIEMSDLMLSPIGEGEPVKMLPAIEPIVTDARLAALVEVYGAAARADEVHVALDILIDEHGQPLATVPMRVAAGTSPEIVQADAQFITTALPPGRYLARSTVRRAGTTAGHMTRPFRVARAGVPAAIPGGTRPPAAGPLPREITLVLLSGLAAFNPPDLLSPAVLNPSWAAASARAGGSARALARARAGDFGAAAAMAAADKDVALAAFLGGLERFAGGSFDLAAVQFQDASRADPTFGPSRLFLGAALAALDRHREAAGLIQGGSNAAAPIAAVSMLAGEEWIKAGLPMLAVPPLELALNQPGADARARKLLGLAYALGNRPADAVAALAPYLAEHPSDQPALLAAIFGAYVKHLSAPDEGPAADRDRTGAWVKAYTGPMQPLVGAWNRFLQGQ